MDSETIRVSGAVRAMRRKVTVAIGRAHRGLSRGWANVQLRAFRVGYLLQHPTSFNRAAARLSILAVIFVATWMIVPSIQGAFGDHMDADHLVALRGVYVTLGGALIGATAVTLSIVMIAVQLNFARLPHALFREVSSDPRLLLEFAFTFLCGLVVALLSLIPDKSAVGASLVLAGLLCCLTLTAFLDAYGRALRLVSPLHQLEAVVRHVRRDMRRWASRARRFRPLFEQPGDRILRDHDWNRFRFFMANEGWDREARQGVSHAISFANRYARDREYDVSAAAFRSIEFINVAFVRTRGRTFFASDPHFNTGIGEDPFITFVLEELRKFASTAVATENEELIRQLMASLTRLGVIYAAIDYGQKLHANLHHTQLAAGHLASLVELCAPKATPDLLLEGARQIGRSAKTLVKGHQSLYITGLGEKLAGLGAIGIARPNFRPVTQVAVRELSELTLLMLASDEYDPSYAIKRLRTSITSVALAGLAVDETPLTREHDSLVSPYYSTTEYGSFAERLSDMFNHLAGLPADNEQARASLRHVANWAKDLYGPQKRILLAAVQQQSSLVFSVIHWTCHVVKALVTLSESPAAGDHLPGELRKAARFLLGIFTFIPSDKESVLVADNYTLVDEVFDAGMHSKGAEAFDVEDFAGKVLVEWAMKGGTLEDGAFVVEHSLRALLVLALFQSDNVQAARTYTVTRVRNALATALATLSVPTLQGASDALRGAATHMGDYNHSYSSVDVMMRQIDGDDFAQGLIALADELDGAVQAKSTAEA